MKKIFLLPLLLLIIFLILNSLWFQYLHCLRYLRRQYHAFMTPAKPSLFLSDNNNCAIQSSSISGRRRQYFHLLIKFRLYIIVHDQSSLEMMTKWSSCSPWVRILQIPSTKYFESIVYVKLLPDLQDDWQNLDVIGLCTYRSIQFLPFERLKLLLELSYYGKYDVLPVMNSGERLLSQAIDGHTKQFMIVWTKFLQNLNFTIEEIITYSEIEVFYRNSFLIKPVALLPLIHFMQHAIDKVEHNRSIKSLLSSNAHYRESMFRGDTAQKIFQKPYYEWHPFLFERLPCFYFAIQNFTVFSALQEIETFTNPTTFQFFQIK